MARRRRRPTIVSRVVACSRLNGVGRHPRVAGHEDVRVHGVVYSFEVCADCGARVRPTRVDTDPYAGVPSPDQRQGDSPMTDQATPPLAAAIAELDRLAHDAGIPIYAVVRTAGRDRTTTLARLSDAEIDAITGIAVHVDPEPVR